jgi:hypothetical protein
MLRETPVLHSKRRHELAIVAPFAGGGCLAADALGLNVNDGCGLRRCRRVSRRRWASLPAVRCRAIRRCCVIAEEQRIVPSDLAHELCWNAFPAARHSAERRDGKTAARCWTSAN